MVASFIFIFFTCLSFHSKGSAYEAAREANPLKRFFQIRKVPAIRIPIPERPNHPLFSFYYINGVLNTEHECFMSAVSISNKLCNYNVFAFYNPSQSSLPIDCINTIKIMRSKKTKTTLRLRRHLENDLKNHKNLIIFAHSAGSVILFKALMQIKNIESYASRIRIYTFAPACPIPQNLGVDVKNFVSEKDIIIKLYPKPTEAPEYWDNIELLPSGIDEKFEHIFMSPTYQDKLEDLCTHIKNNFFN